MQRVGASFSGMYNVPTRIEIRYVVLEELHVNMTDMCNNCIYLIREET